MGILQNLSYYTKDKHSIDRSDASETSSPSSGFSMGSPPIPAEIVPKEEKDLTEFYDRLNLE